MKKLSQRDRAKLLGSYYAPTGYYDHTKDMAFLGHVTCDVSHLIAGSWQEILLDYEIGAAGVADGAWMKVTFKFYSDWALFQTGDPKGANYISAEYQAGPLLEGQSPATVQSLKVRFDQKGHERPFQKAIIVDTVDGFLKPGDHIIIRLGDKRAGGPGTRVQSFVEKGFRFRCYVDPLGTSRFAPIPGDIVLDVLPDCPAQIRLVGPRIVKTAENFSVIVAVEDRWGNTCWNLAATALLTGYLNGKKAFERQQTLSSQGWATVKLQDIPSQMAGELEIRAKLLEYPMVPEKSFFIRFDEQLSFPRAYYADLHVHSEDTVGTNDTTYNLSYGRDVAGLDILGYTANDFQITKTRWDKAVELIHAMNKDGEFVCYPGTEWCGSSCAGGDHNVVFLHDKIPEFPFDRHGNVCRSFEWNEDMQATTIEPGAWPLEELWATYIHDPEGHLLMPHVGGRRCNLDWHHPVLERLAEIESAWGHFPWLYEDAMQRGYKLGVSANSDEHRGRCGGGVPGTAVFGTKGGLTGVVAERLDRKTIGQALRARHTFATTGERLFAYTTCGQYIQGDEFHLKGSAEINYRFLGDMGWDEIAAFDHSGCIWQRNLQAEYGFSTRRIRLRWGGARIKDRYRWAAWKGTITITNGVINSFTGRGFEHPEESVWRAGPTCIAFRSDTYGDTDILEIDVSNLAHCHIKVEGTIDGYVKVGNPMDGNPFVHCPNFSWEISGEALLKAHQLQQTLGGADLFLALERLSDAGMPREVTGTLDVTPHNGPHGFRPIYFRARQIDDAKVWTSAMFINFKDQ